MRKRLYTLLMLLATASLLLVSCKKDNADLIIGTWVNNTDTYEETTTNGVSEKEYYHAGLLTLTFANNGIVTVTAIDETTGKAETQEEPYAVNGDKLLWEDEIYTIKQLDLSKMVVEVEEDETWEENGTSISVHDIFHMSFDRQ